MKLLNSARMSFPITFLILFSVWMSQKTQVFGQTPESISVQKQLQSEIAQLESSSEADWGKSEAVLKLAMRDPAFRDLATSTLALVHLKRGHLEAVANFNRKTRELFPRPSPDKQSFLLRIQLCCDIADGSETVTERFSNSVRLTLDEKLSKENRLASAAMLGVLVGMLEPDAAQSPIDRKLLRTERDSLRKSQDVELASTFDANYRKAKSHADALADWLKAHQQLSIIEAAGVAEDTAERLRIATHDRTQSVHAVHQATKELRKRIYDLLRKLESIPLEIEALLFQWNCHPEIHNPIMPDRRTIVVNTMERVKVGSHKEQVKNTRYGRNGEMETSYKDKVVDDYETRRRSQPDIDRDIDAIYLPLMNRYRLLKATGQAFLERKATYESEQKNAVAEIAEANREIEKLEEKGREGQADLKLLRSKASIANEAVRALKSGRVQTAFRPPNFELIDYILEAKGLQKNLMGTSE